MYSCNRNNVFSNKNQKWNPLSSYSLKSYSYPPTSNQIPTSVISILRIIWPNNTLCYSAQYWDTSIRCTPTAHLNAQQKYIVTTNIHSKIFPDCTNIAEMNVVQCIRTIFTHAQKKRLLKKRNSYFAQIRVNLLVVWSSNDIAECPFKTKLPQKFSQLIYNARLKFTKVYR